ncbi:MAG: hypothetical protein ACRC2H_00970 [Silanimonas sp.]
MSKAKKSPEMDDRMKARHNWQRYEYVRQRGHRDWVTRARLCEDFYLGAGAQWSAEDRAQLEEERRPAEEVNLIMPAVNAVIGYQINNRMDIAFRPRGGKADQEKAATLSKVAKQICDNTQYRWRETQVFGDGLIEGRGYFDIRISFNDSMIGEVDITDLDPRDVMPDPDGKSYDPDEWQDVIITRWLTLDEIEWNYGTDKRKEVEASGTPPEDTDFGDDLGDESRNKFGDERTGYVYDSQLGPDDGVQVPRWRVIDRQFWRVEPAQVAVYKTGDIRIVEHLNDAERGQLLTSGAQIIRRLAKRVRWLVSTADTVLFDEWSPYEHLTVVPYFPLFRRGKTRSMVDNAISPQRVVNKSVSQYLHVINSSANSGFAVEQNSLTNMTTEDLEVEGAKTGLILEYAKGSQKPEKIQPNQVPTGIDRVIEMGVRNVGEVTGVNETMKGEQKASAESGVAIQSRQFIAQQQQAIALDNLSRTRHLVAHRMMKLIQRYYDDPRILAITDTNEMGEEVTEQLPINQPQPDGSILNDLTMGEYDVVVTDQPLQVTFENSQFTAALEMREAGVPIPDSFVIRYSPLADKAQIIEAMGKQGQPTDPTLEAKAALLKAQTDKTNAETVAKKVETLFSATEAAQNVAALPQVAPLADEVLGSAGFEDMNAAPIMPLLSEMSVGAPAAPGAVPEPPRNTNPLTPRNPSTGMNAGIEGGLTDGEVESIPG